MKIIVFFILLCPILAAQNVPTFHWPLVRISGNAAVDLINDNFGDYRNDRFHLGIDLQDAYGSDVEVRPIERGRICHRGNASTYTWFVLEHGDNLNTSNCDPANYHSVYLHLTHELTNKQIGQIIELNEKLASASDMQANHLHLNISTNPNVLGDPNDDNVINPLDGVIWSEIENGTVRPHDNTSGVNDDNAPYLHYLYLHTPSPHPSVEILSYPDIDHNNFVSLHDPNLNYHKLEYQGGTQANPEWQETIYQVPRLLIYDIEQGAIIRLFLHATDKWADSGLTPNIIRVYIDQNADAAPGFNNRYYELQLTEINQINGNRPNSNIVFSREAPFDTHYNTVPSWSNQYYHLFVNNDNNNNRILPNQILENPMNIFDGAYSEEGMHRIEVLLKSDQYREEDGNNYVRNETTGVMYYYLLRNDNGYMDLALSGVYQGL